MSQTDIWAVSPSTSATYYRAAAAVAGAGALTLLTRDAGPNGVGYKVIITSSGIDTGITFTIVGTPVGGDPNHAPVTEVLTGASASSVTSTNFFANIVSITASGAAAGTVAIGTTGSLALPRCRVRGVYYVGAASAGTIVLNSNATSGTQLLRVDTPATATWAAHLLLPGEGALTARSTGADFAIVTLTQVSLITLFCS